jgi:hypothetical protein
VTPAAYAVHRRQEVTAAASGIARPPTSPAPLSSWTHRVCGQPVECIGERVYACARCNRVDVRAGELWLNPPAGAAPPAPAQLSFTSDLLGDAC